VFPFWVTPTIDIEPLGIRKYPVGHVFCLEVLRDKEQGIRLKARKINGLED
jgi:hypothetical protein